MIRCYVDSFVNKVLENKIQSFSINNHVMATVVTRWKDCVKGGMPRKEMTADMMSPSEVWKRTCYAALKLIRVSAEEL